MTEPTALLPCPFCGGSVELEETTSYYNSLHGERQWWGVVCRNTTNRGGSCAIQQRPSASKDAAIDRWNRRTASPAVAGEQTMADVIAACNGTEAFGLIMGLRAQVALLEAVIDEQKASATPQPTQAQAVQEWDPVPAKACIKPTYEAADAFWEYWKAKGETHKHGYYESTWGAINKALACGWTQPAQAQAGAVPRYRLLVRGQDTIQADDEFLREDGATWLKDPSGIFVGCMYEGTIFLPARRAIDEAHGIEGGQHAE